MSTGEDPLDYLEQMFDYIEVTPAAVDLSELQQRVHRMQGTTVRRTLESLPGLAGIIRLKTGGAYSVDSPSLAMALMAGPSQAGEWSAVVGAPDFGLEAAAHFGLDLSRTVVVPRPGDHWLSVVAGLVDVASVVLVRPPTTPTEQQAARLQARLRQKDATLICWGCWPRCEATLAITESEWVGLGSGHGRLVGRRVVVQLSEGGRSRAVPLWLPGSDLRVIGGGLDEQPLMDERPLIAVQAS